MPLALFLTAQRTRDVADIHNWQLSELGYVVHAADYSIAGNARDDAISAAMLALVEKTHALLDLTFESEAALRAYIDKLIKHAVAEEIDRVATVAGLGPKLKTKLKRLAAGKKALKRHDPRPALVPGINSGFDEFEGDGDLADKWLCDHRVDTIEAAERFWWFTWAADQAYALAADDPLLTKAMKLAEGEDHHFESGLPSITAIAKAVGMQRETLRDRFRRLGRQLAALDPEGGIEYLGKVWEVAARSAGSDFSDIGEDQIAA